MISSEVKNVLVQLGKTSHGQALKIFFEGELAELKDVTKAESWEDTVGRQKAVVIIEKFLKSMEESPQQNVIKKNYT